MSLKGAEEPPKSIDCNDCPVCNGDMKEDYDFENYDFENNGSDEMES